jgi:hypothetical protein
VEAAIIRQLYGGSDAPYSSDARVGSFMSSGLLFLAAVLLSAAVWLVRRRS